MGMIYIYVCVCDYRPQRNFCRRQALSMKAACHTFGNKHVRLGEWVNLGFRDV